MIAVLSDFGQTEYLGIMKGVIYSHCNDAVICDLTNSIKPQCIKEGAWVLLCSYSFFPKGTIFLSVVDPGVGSARRAILIKSNNYHFVGPDNGLMAPAARKDGIIEAYMLPAPEDASKTFHGRDVFAPAAARLHKGELPKAVRIEPGSIASHEFHLEGRTGEIVKIDHFGNIITNLPATGKKEYTVSLKGYLATMPFYRTYEEAGKGLFLIEGSSGTMEISARNFDASAKLTREIGERITIR